MGFIYDLVEITLTDAGVTGCGCWGKREFGKAVENGAHGGALIDTLKRPCVELYEGVLVIEFRLFSASTGCGVEVFDDAPKFALEDRLEVAACRIDSTSKDTRIKVEMSIFRRI